MQPWRWRIGSLYYHKLVKSSTPPSCDCYSHILFLPPLPHTLRATMTDAHERITLPPISSFDISPSSKHHNPFQAAPSPRGTHLRGRSSWDGSSGGSNHPHNEFDELPYRCGTFSSDALCYSHKGSPRCPSASPGPGRYDTLDSSYYDCRIATGQTRRNHSPYSEPTVPVVPAYESISTSLRPRSSSAALDRGLIMPQASRHSQKRLASCISSREPSPDSQATSSPSVTNRPNTRSHVQSTVPSSRSPAGAGAGAITSASGVALSPQMTAFINSTPGDTHDSKTVGVTRRRTPPTRKRKASEMLGAGSPGSEDRALSPEPSESEAKKKYKKKMNVRHYRAQNKDAMTQLRDALPEHMRPPERQAKAYVTLSGTS